MVSQLLVQSCSASKSTDDNPIPALERYDGYFYKIIKKAMSDNKINPSIDICILSAEYGLLKPEEKIPYYDRKMDKERAEELRSEVVPALENKIVSGGYERVVVNMGTQYRHAIEGFADELSIEVLYIEGAGIGEKGHELKEFLRSENQSQSQD